MKTVWIGIIPEIFGYGISVVELSEESCYKALKKEYREWKKLQPDSSTNFDDSFEYYGGSVKEVQLGKCYYEDFKQ